MSSKIKSIHARQILSIRGHPGIETTVTTEDGSTGIAVVTAGVSIGEHEVFFVNDGGKKWNGLGQQKAVDIINNIIGPTVVGLDATNQSLIDKTMLKSDGTPNKTRLGGNSIASVSAATLKAASKSLGIPLYQHIGGVNARVIPVPGVISFVGGERYGGGQRAGDKPSYSFMAYGFKCFSEASYACWELKNEFHKTLRKKLDMRVPTFNFGFALVPPGKVDHDRELWEMMVETIDNLGYKNRVGIQVDVAAGTYFDKKKNAFVGLFSREDKTREDLIELYKDAVKNYPFLVIEDPLDENDYEGHAIVTKELGIQIVGDDLFTTNIERVRKGIEVKACNTILLKVNQIGSIAEAFDMVEFAYKHNYAVMPCSSRGEGSDIADYSVGLGTGQMREGGFDDTANRALQIEEELGSRAKFLGKAAYKTS